MKRSLEAAAAIALALAPGPTRAQEETIRVSREELDEHFVAGERVVRSSGGESYVFRPLGLDIVVDEKGVVTAARRTIEADRQPAQYRGDEWLEPALAAARQWRFRPFLRGGRAVAVRGTISVIVLPPERRPARHVPFPEARREDITISLAATSCFGSCPDYTIILRGDGRVRFEGRGHVLVPGIHEYRVPPERVDELVRQFRAADFWSLDAAYQAEIEDVPTRTLSFGAGSQTKSVVETMGPTVGMPAIVLRLQEAVDAAADTARWIDGNERTVETLAAEGFGFRSREAATMFVESIGRAPDQVPLAMLDQGVRLDRSIGRIGFWTGSSIREGNAAELGIAVAVANGRIAIFDRLDRMRAMATLGKRQLDLLLADAAAVHSPHLVRRLLERGARSRAVRSRPPLIAALEGRNDGVVAPDADKAAVVRLLMRRGVRLEARDSSGWTALQHAYDDPPEFARMLIEAGADVDARDREDDDQPLLYLTDDEEIALLAIAAGADLGLKDSDGYTLAEIARRKQWRRVEALLAAKAPGTP